MKNILFGLIKPVTRGFVHRFFLCIVVLFLLSASLNPTKAYAAKFSIYDKVEVYNTGGVGLRLRQWYSTTSSIVTKMTDGTQMTVYGGPYQADGYNWWYLYGYVDGSSYGYSAGYYYGYAAEDYLKLVSASCTYSISSSSQSFDSNGGSGNISVTTSSGCSWTATSNTSWITITSGSSSSGNGTVNYSVASNSSTSSRTGTMTIAGQTFTVTQSAASSPPTVTTGTYQTISSTSVQLFGTVNPNGLTTTGWFEWGTTSSYGNTTNKESLGGGTDVVQMLHTISGLTASTTYHFRAVAQSSAGTSYGEDMSFTTEAPAATKPTVTTNAATSVTSTTAMLNGTVNPNGAATTGWFEWGTTSSYGNTTQTFSGGSGTSDITMSWSISSLSPNTTYHFRAVGQNSAGTTYGSDMTFTTESCTYSISSSSQSFNSNGGSGSISVTTSSGCSWTATSNASWITITSGSSVSGNGTVNYSVASNSSTSSRTGTMTIAGQTFTVTQSVASSPPTVTTGTYQTTSSSTVQLFGTVNPNGLSTTGWFQWGTTASYGNKTNEESLGSGTSVVQMLHEISGLSASTTYHFRAVGKNSSGTSYGDDMSFTTEAPAATKPTVTTNAATSVSSTTATLNGIVNPNAASTTGWFEWGTTSSYGNTTQTFSGGSGTSDVTMSWSISGLSPNTTYHFRAVGQNSAGIAYGSDMTFKTGAASGTPSPTPKTTPTPTPEATPTSTTTTPKITAGGYHSFALKSDGTVWTWGYNEYGQLGDASYTNKSIPVKASGLGDITDAAGGCFHSIALKSDGTVYVWGRNNWGQFGDGSNTDKNTPFQLSGLNDVIAVAAGYYDSMLLKSDGTVWMCGGNYRGQLGDETTTDKNSLAQVTGLNNVTTIAAGRYHSMALKSDGTVWAWGDNTFGQLGDGTTNMRTTPVQVNGLSDVIAIAVGEHYSTALESDGTVRTWGYNGDSQLGDGTNTNRSSPVQVSGLSGVTAIAAGEDHGMALKSDGTIWVWGYNNYGQLGDGTFTNKNTPIQVSDLSNVTAIACGYSHSMVLKSDWTVWAWGRNDSGQLGDGTTIDRKTPVQVDINLGQTTTSTPTPEATPTLGENEVKVPGTACPFFAGVEDASDSDDNYTNSQPVEISLPAGVTSITFEVSGKIGNCEDCYGSDITTPNDSYEKYGISLISAPINSLIGVFLSNGSPSYSKKPARLSNDGSVPDSSTPAIQQSFFIYHFSTSRSNIATITVPEETTRLFLGGLDGWGWNNNVGSYQVKITWNYADTTTPTPSPTPIQSTCTDSYEPNDSSSAAYGPLSSSSSYNGKICTDSDVDWFKVNTTSAGTISLSLTVPSSQDYDLELYNPSYAWVAGSTNSTGSSESISYNVTTTGTYYMRIFGYNGSYNTSNSYTLTYTFTADGTPTPTPTPTAIATPTTTPESEDLLKKYAPILYMHGQERFHPTNVQVMLDNSELIKKKMGEDKVVYKNEDNTLTLDMLVTSKYNNKKHYLKLKKDAEETAKDKDAYWYWKKEQTVYGREFTSDEDKTKTVLQYWVFYVYNDWGTSVELGNSHQGDWEMIQIILNNSKQPEEITYGFHHGGQTFEWDNEEVKKSDDGNHPLVYVTLGGHGCWNKSGSRAWYQEMKKFGCQECIDETADDGDVLYSNTLSENEVQASSEKYSYELVNLRDISSSHWIYWKGYWGNQTEEKKVSAGRVDIGISGPPSPSYIDYISKKSNYPRWKFPIKWANSPLPSSYTVCASDNNKVIPHNLKGTSVSYNEYCGTDSDKCGKQCLSLKIVYSEQDLVFDVYSLDGNEVDLKISRYKRTGEVFDVEFEGLEIPKKGKASFTFSAEKNPTFEIGIDHDRNGIYESHRSPDFLEVK